MKKYFPLLVLFFSVSDIYGQQTQFQNSGFEIWNYYEHPDYWTTPCMSISFEYYPSCSMVQEDCSKSTEGNCSAQLISDTTSDLYGLRYIGGSVAANTNADGSGSSQIPLNALPDSLTFDFFSQPVGTNNLIGQYAHITDQYGSPLANIETYLDNAPTGRWVHFSAPFVYSSKAVNSTIDLTLTSGTYTDTHMGSTLWVDNVKLVYNQPCPANVVFTPVTTSCPGTGDGHVQINWTQLSATGALVNVWPVGTSEPQFGFVATTSRPYTSTGNLQPGTYAVQLLSADNYCGVTDTITITEPAALTAAASATPVTDGTHNGTATATAGGGTPPYNYSWSGGQNTRVATGLAIGVYHVTITDSRGCGNVASVFVGYTAPSVTTNGASNIQLTSAQLNGIVNPNYTADSITFQWGTSVSYGNSNNATPFTINGGNSSTESVSLFGLTANTTYHYRIVATTYGTKYYGSDQQFYTTANTTPAITTNGATDVTATSAQLNGIISTYSASATSIQFDWGTTSGYGNTAAATPASASGSGSTNVSASLTGLQPNTTYYYQATAAVNGNTITSGQSQFNTTATGIPVVSFDNISVYPNPAKSQFTINTHTGDTYTMELYNVLGQKVMGGVITQPVTHYDITNMSVGIYTVTLKRDEAVKAYRLVIVSE